MRRVPMPALLALTAATAAAACNTPKSAGFSGGCLISWENSELEWLVVGQSVKFRWQVPVTGWVGMGIGKQNPVGVECAMTGSSLVFAGPTIGVSAEKATACATPRLEPEAVISGESVTVVGSNMVLQWTRALNMPGLGPDLVIGPQKMIFAWNPTGPYGQHSASTRWVQEIDLSLAPATAPPTVAVPDVPLTAAPTGGPLTAAPSRAPTAAATTAGCTASHLSQYSCMKVDGQVAVHWKVLDDGGGIADLGLSTQQSMGWLAIAFPSSPGNMPGAEAYVTAPNGQGWYSLGGRSAGDIQAKLSPSQQLTGASATTEGGTTVIHLSGVSFADVTQVDILWAYQSGGQSAFPSLVHSQRSGLRLNLRSGASTTTAAKAVDHDLVKAHGAMMLTAWCFVMPLAVIVKRFAKQLGLAFKVGGENGLPLAFVIHALSAFTVACLTLAAIIVAWIEFSGLTEKAHGPIGLIVLILVLVQLVVGGLRPDPSSPMRKVFNIVHRIIALGCMVLGVVNCFTGAWNVGFLHNDPDGKDRFTGAAAGGVGLFGLLLIVLTAVQLSQKKSGASEAAVHVEQTQVEGK
eukprot:TRINITY_DN14883_c0_g1_i1.p1 TRINITY_DN14883_c0_g1~~TRINITY_DN14883_c0_g1_i1.p1  ORF type:complete len:576 (+),score=118.23 TRINITY_DN14883_c0_g1_i1:87-1814(+)